MRLGALDSAYDVQDALTARRLARGDRRVGWKLGYTSAAMREQMGVAQPNFGPLLGERARRGRRRPTSSSRGWSLRSLSCSGRTPGPDADVEEVLAACRSARVALEVVDSVWTGYRFDLEHNTADGSSAAGVVLGAEIPLDRLDEVEVTLLVAGVEVAHGRGADASGHPAAGVAWLAAQLAGRGLALQDGDVVITGGLTAAHPLEHGRRWRRRFEHAGFGARTVQVHR